MISPAWKPRKPFFFFFFVFLFFFFFIKKKKKEKKKKKKKAWFSSSPDNLTRSGWYGFCKLIHCNNYWSSLLLHNLMSKENIDELF